MGGLTAWSAGRAAGLVWHLASHARQMRRRFGVWALCLPLVLMALGLTVFWAQRHAAHAEVLRAALREQTQQRQAEAVLRGQRVLPTAGRAALQAFDQALLAHEEIPAALQAVLRAGEEEGLVLARGDYHLQPDAAGRFLRYRMSLPVQGPADAVHRFMAKALREQPMLALASVQFQRENAATGNVDARIQWLLFARLPDRGVLPQGSGESEE